MRKGIPAAFLGVLGALLVGVPSLAAAGGATTCTDTLAPGTYGKVIVPAGASCLTFAGPVTIRGGVSIGEGATFVLGSEDNSAHTGNIYGGVNATNAATVEIHFSTITGGVNISGGAGPFGGPFEVTFNTIEDSVINGSVNISGYDGFWQGFFRNHVNGSFNYNNNTLVDPDGNEVQTNHINGSMNCSGNTPAPQQGDSEGSPNTVTGAKTGQCAGL
jgi:hypothetical protein